MSRRMLKKTRNHATNFFVFATLLIVFGTTLTKTTIINASNKNMPERYKCYKVIKVEKDMTLWDIASEYRTMEYEDLNEYIDEVAQINHMTDVDDLQYGSVLSIPYYTDDRK